MQAHIAGIPTGTIGVSGRLCALFPSAAQCRDKRIVPLV